MSVPPLSLSFLALEGFETHPPRRPSENDQTPNSNLHLGASPRSSRGGFFPAHTLTLSLLLPSSPSRMIISQTPRCHRRVLDLGPVQQFRPRAELHETLERGVGLPGGSDSRGQPRRVSSVSFPFPLFRRPSLPSSPLSSRFKLPQLPAPIPRSSIARVELPCELVSWRLIFLFLLLLSTLASSSSSLLVSHHDPQRRDPHKFQMAHHRTLHRPRPV